MPSFIKNFAPSRFSLKHILTDSFLLLVSLYLSLWLRTGDEGLPQHLPTLHTLAAVFVVTRIVVFLAFGVYRSMWRYISTNDATRLAAAVLFTVPIFISITYISAELGFMPRSFFIIDAFVATALLMSIRLSRRWLFERTMRPQKGRVTLGKLLIYGAGQNGRLLAQRLLSDPNREMDLLGYVDDDTHKQGKLIHGIPVLGTHADLEELLARAGATDIVVAITNPPAELMRELVILCRRLNVRVQRIAHFDAPNIARSEALYRQVELKDLLNRASTDVDLPALKSLIEGRVVLVTGAGGSIGAELSRQLARLNPAKLLLLDHSELSLFEIDRELRPRTDDFAKIIPLLADIKNLKALTHVFQTYKPQVVFHAAAYKHVHLVEANPGSAALNNVGGTWNLLQLSESFGVERFVMISTDKAVNPVGAMGASKRVCELLTSHIGVKTGRPYSSVRFGNVLGSSGSLIPLLEKQIRDGGPVTLTHPDMTRYFMLIPEAVSLVLMSATLSEPGDVNVLKMGEPIRIHDLAKNMIALMGRSEEEVPIAFTGVRPGEKMFEELYLTGHELTTRHPDILTVPRGDARSKGLDIEYETQKLLRLAEAGDSGVTQLLLQLANDSSARADTSLRP